MRNPWPGPPLIPGKYEVSCGHSSVEAHPVSVSGEPMQGSGKIYNSTAFVHFRLLVLDRVQATSKYASFTEAEGPGETKEDF